MAFNGVDYFGIENLLSAEELAFMDKVRDWVESRYMPRIRDYFDKGEFDLGLVPELAGLGALGLKIDGYGCPGQSSMIYGLVCRELERGDSGLRSFVSVQNSLVMYPIHKFGSEAQKSRWLPAMARGERIGCFGLTERGGGSDPAHMQTRAERRGGDYILNGSKMWITNGVVADVAVIWARTADGIRGFLVEKGMPGFEAHDIAGKYSARASVTSALSLKNVRVPDSNLLPGTLGLKSPLMCLNQARYGIAWGAVGAAMACYSIALDYARNRIQFDAPIASPSMINAENHKSIPDPVCG